MWPSMWRARRYVWERMKSALFIAAPAMRCRHGRRKFGAAEKEGTKITYLSAPQEVLTRDGKVVGLRSIRMELTEPDSSGRKRPIPIPGSEYDY